MFLLLLIGARLSTNFEIMMILTTIMEASIVQYVPGGSRAQRTTKSYCKSISCCLRFFPLLLIGARLSTKLL